MQWPIYLSEDTAHANYPARSPLHAATVVQKYGISLTAIGSLALGIGATTAVFSVIYAILMNPYPYAAPDRMVRMRLWDASNHRERVRPHGNTVATDSKVACRGRRVYLG